jgi:hypothetical protein
MLQVVRFWSQPEQKHAIALAIVRKVLPRLQVQAHMFLKLLQGFFESVGTMYKNL